MVTALSPLLIPNNDMHIPIQAEDIAAWKVR
jgi:hypothetical protein